MKLETLVLILFLQFLASKTFGLPAFPGAEGFGALATGGRGGKVMIVDNLNDNGKGSLREACNTKGARTIVFSVAGEINLKSPLVIENSFLTIAGQTAPGSGITLKSKYFDFSGPMFQIRKGAHDIIIRYLKMRVGRAENDDSRNNDNLTIYNGSRIIFDHISAQWASDENMTIRPGSQKGDSVKDVTFQRCIIGSTLYPHSTGTLISRGRKLENGFDRYSIHHNLYIHNGHRNPRIVGDLGTGENHVNVEVINNIVYNWKHRVGTTRGNAHIDFLGNYWKTGPLSKMGLDHVIRHEHVTNNNRMDFQPDPSIYIAGNIHNPNFLSPNEDNWPLLSFHYNDGRGMQIAGNQLPRSWFRSKRIKQGMYPVQVQSAQESYLSIIGNTRALGDIGDNARVNGYGQRVNKLDKVDKKLIQDVLNETGPAKKKQAVFVSDYGGYPETDSGTPYKDTDRDGMPDLWEIRKGLNLNDSSDANITSLNSEGYTNIEVFINSVSVNPAQPSEDGECW